MKRDTEQPSGTMIELDIPVQDSGLFAHKATDEILLLVARNRFSEFTISDIATQTGQTKPAVSRAVDVLVANELLTEEADGTQRLVRLNRDRITVPDDPYLQIPQTSFQVPVQGAVDRLQTELDNIVGIVLYGSVARGEADRRSDIDLWVLVSEDRPAQQRAANRVATALEDRSFDTGRYAFDIDVEAVSSIPRYTEEIRDIIVAGITLYQTDQFDTVTDLLQSEVMSDE